MELVFTEQDEQTLVRLSGEGSEIYKQLVFDLSAATLASRVSKKSSVLVRWNSSCDLETYLSCLKDFYTDFVQVILLQYVEQASSYQNSWLNTLLYYTNARTFKPEVTYQKLACIERFLHATMAPETNDLTVCDLFFSFAKFKQELAKIDRQYWTTLSKLLAEIETGLDGFRQAFSALYLSGGMAEKIQKETNTVWNFKNQNKDILHLPWVDRFGNKADLNDVSVPTQPLKNSICAQKLRSTQLMSLIDLVEKNASLLDRVGELNQRKDLLVEEYVELKVIAEFEKHLDCLVKEFFKPQKFLDAATRGRKRHPSGLGERRMEELQLEIFKLVQSLYRRVVFLRDVLQNPSFAENTLSVVKGLSEVLQSELDYQQVQSVSDTGVSI